jgi:hypothetical protein
MKTFVKSQINLLCILNSKYNIPKYLSGNDDGIINPNTSIDISITGVSVQKGLFKNNQIKINTYFFRPSIPCYITYLTDGDDISFYIHKNSNDIDKNINPTQIKEIIKNILKEIK